MRQVLRPGHPVDFVTPDEMAAMMPPKPRQVTRIRSPQTIQLDATGSGRDEVYQVPAGYEYSP
jgi:hypothetical protein